MKTRTKQRTIIEHSQFRQMLSYHTCYTNKSEQQDIKNSLKGEIMAAYEDKWQRLADGTRSAIDELCFMATEKGFCYASKGYLTRHNISKRTLDRAINFLSNKGLIYIAYRRRGCLNLTGKPVFLFISHPYFEYWTSFLSLNVVDNDVANVVTGNSQTVSLSIDSADDPFSTSFSPRSLSKESVKDRSENDETPTDSDLDYLPQYIDKEFGTIYKVHFGLNVARINQLWKILHQQAYKANIEPENVSQAGIWSLKQLIGQMKIKKVKNIYAYYTQIVKDKCHDIFLDECENEYGADFSKLAFEIPH
ncbi:hypothetical protein [Sporolactobacillus putidus]|uniref:Helix-turn-helix domain-containing protein n=1 Tax=Sporolactobacillus putidus TaxID=492735 RepID=A0A917W106_9BACL|nr:hypothetical protein [Sporolactobacillus putidus]GGL55632.1 hypothetical protein GCM10007968_19710 [Sporolactobacillus putidus]